MNELLQKHGCSNVFSIPEGLKELMADITREVLREQPQKLFDFIANYLSVLLLTREHGLMAVKILDDLCDCKPSLSEHLLQLGMESQEAEMLATVIKQEIEGFEPAEGKEKVREIQILKKILARSSLDEDMSARVCQVARNAFKDYWYRKKLMEKNLNLSSDEPWEIAAQHTLEIYKKTKPSFSELNRAAEKIQAAYRGYYIRRNLLRHLKPKKKIGPKIELPGPPLDIAASREIDLGPVTDIKVTEDNVCEIFEEDAEKKLGLRYDLMRTITHVINDEKFLEEKMGPISDKKSQALKDGDKTRFDGTSEQEQLLIESDNDVNIERHRSNVSEAVTRHSRVQSLSFAKVPPEIIPVIDKEDDENIPEELHPENQHSEPEVIKMFDMTPVLEEEEIHNIPEDITVHTDGEESLPASSLPSSEFQTDVEDTVGEVTTGGEEEV